MRDDDDTPGAVYELDVTKQNGSTVKVHLDSNYGLDAVVLD